MADPGQEREKLFEKLVEGRKKLNRFLIDRSNLNEQIKEAKSTEEKIIQLIDEARQPK